MSKKIFRSHKSLFSFLIVFLLFINLFILCEDNLIVWIKAVYRNSQLQEEKKYYIEQIDKTTKEMEQFYQDHNNIERLAREKYKMKQSDEDVFIVE
jgi:cell division protein FtsB